MVLLTYEQQWRLLYKVEEDILNARNFSRVSQDTHKKVWYQLHTVPDSTKWPNVFTLKEYFPYSRSSKQSGEHI